MDLLLLSGSDGRVSLVRCSIFFFQAEDGIRDLVRSRGLGDVYKRQSFGGSKVSLIVLAVIHLIKFIALPALSFVPDALPLSLIHI